MKYKFADSVFLAKYANIMDRSIDLSLVCLLIIPILSVACNDLGGTAYAQLLSHYLGKKAAASQTPARQIRNLQENAGLEVRNNDTSKALATINLVEQQSQSTPSLAQCIVIPGPAMSFREVCPSGNNATTPGSAAVQTRQQPSARTPFLASAQPLPSARPPLPLKQPPVPINPPLIPAYNNTNLLSLLQNNPGLTPSSSPVLPLLKAKTFREYNNTLYGVSIQYPSSWRIEEGDNFLFGSAVTNVATLVPPGSRDYHTYASISIEPSNRTSLAGYLNNVISQYSHLHGFLKTGSDTNVILAGSPAYRLEYSDLEPGYPVKAIEVGTIIGDKVYFISYITDPQTYSVYLPSVDTMIKSLSINSLNTAHNSFNSTKNGISPGGPVATGSIPK